MATRQTGPPARGGGPVDHLAPHRSQLLKGSRSCQHSEGHLLAIPFIPHHLDGTTSEKVQGCAGCSLFKDDLAIPVDPFVEDPGEPLKVPVREVPEERYLLEEVHEVLSPAAVSEARPNITLAGPKVSL